MYFERKTMDTMFRTLDEFQTKVAKGDITHAQLDWFLNLTPENRNFLVVAAKKFAMLADLGIVTVPDDYAHEGRMFKFQTDVLQAGKYPDLDMYSSGFTDANFETPSRFLKSGDRFRVRAFTQVAGECASGDECLLFLSGLNAVYPGAQGALLVFEQGRHLLPKNRKYTSMDRAVYLWNAYDKGHAVPCIDARADGKFDLQLLRYEDGLDAQTAILCFTEVE